MPKLIIAVYNTVRGPSSQQKRVYGDSGKFINWDPLIWRRMGWVTNPVSVSGSVKFNALGNFSITVAGDDPIVGALMHPTARVSILYDRRDVDSTERPEFLMSGKVRNPSGGLLLSDQITFQVQDDWRILQNSLGWVSSNGPLDVVGDENWPPDSPNYTPSWGQYWNATDHGARPQANSWDVAQLTGYWNRDVIEAQVAAGYYPTPFPSLSIGNPASLLGTILTANLYRRTPNWQGMTREQYLESHPIDPMWPVEPNTPVGGRYGFLVSADDGVEDWPDLPAEYWPSVRFDTLESLAQNALSFGDYGLRIRMGGSQLIEYENGFSSVEAADQYRDFTAQFYTPKVWPQVLTPDSGVVTGGSWTLNHPSATRGVVGGPGENAARIFRGTWDQSLEDTYDDMIEVWKDATGADLTWPSGLDQSLQVPAFYLLRSDVSAADKAQLVSYLTSALNDLMAAGAPSTAMNATLSESAGFHYGGKLGYHLGDRMTVESAQGIRFSERIESVEFSLTADDGLTVTPNLGQKQDANAKTASAIIALVSSLQRISKSR